MDKIPQSRSKDAFQNAFVRVFNAINQQRKTLLLIALPILLAGLVGYGWKYQKTLQQGKRRAALDELLSQVTKADQEAGKRKEEILKKAADLRKANADIHKDAVAKLEAEAKAIKPNYAEIRVKLFDFYSKHKDSVAGWNAGMVVAKQDLDQKKFDDAKAITEEIAKASIRSNLYQIQSRFLLVGIYEEQGQFDSAIQQENLLEGLVPEDFVPAAKLAKARTLILKNANEEAKTALQAIVEKHASSAEAQKARAYLTLLKMTRG